MFLVNSFIFICLFLTVKCLSIFSHTYDLSYLFKEFNKTVALCDSSSIDTEWIEQPLDHFNQTDDRKWKMRYLQRLDMWQAGGPIYLLIGGEGKIANWFLQAGTTYELAKETNGAMLCSEHRYYGDSKPFDHFTPENFRYLSSRQALADIALLLESLKRKPEFAESKVVVLGGSYAGNLAAWLKLLYPELADATVASSGPVEAKTDFYEYLETVGNDLKKYGSPHCYEKIENMFKDFETKLKTKDGIEQLKKEFDICSDSDLTKLENKQLLFSGFTTFISILTQYGNRDSIENFCENNKNNLRIFLENEEDILTWNKKEKCYDSDFNHFIETLKTNNNKNKDFMPWLYQTCTEFGYFQTTSSDSQPFTKNIPIDFYFKICSGVFGENFDKNRVEEGVKNTNKMYGGLHPNVSKVVFVNGEIDPWQTLGVLEDISPEAPAKLIPLSSHCGDMFPDQEDDPEELKEARKYIKNLVKEWIGVAYAST